MIEPGPHICLPHYPSAAAHPARMRGSEHMCGSSAREGPQRERGREEEPAHLITVPVQPNFLRCPLRVGQHLQEKKIRLFKFTDTGGRREGGARPPDV